MNMFNVYIAFVGGGKSADAFFLTKASFMGKTYLKWPGLIIIIQICYVAGNS